MKGGSLWVCWVVMCNANVITE